jgi:Flp pilus assembly protein TadD
MALAPNDARAYNNLAWMYAEEKKNLDEALTLARRATELAPNSASVLDTLGWVHYARGSYAEAESVLRKAADLAGGEASIHYHLGLASHQLGKRDEAVFALRRALQLDPKNPQAAAARQILEALGR